MLLQTIITGLSIGGIYALMAVGYSLVFSVLNFSNFAYGSIIMLGSYFAYFSLTGLHVPFALALIISMAGGALVCTMSETLAYRPLRMRGANALFFMIGAQGMGIFLENFVYATIGAHYYSFPNIFKGSFEIFGARIGYMDTFAIVFSFVAIYVLNAFLHHTKQGMAIRAVSYDSAIAPLNGIHINHTISLVFILAGLMSGLSGTFLGLKYMAYPTMGWITNKAYIAAVIGGLGSLPGAVVGSVMLGVLESLVSVYISSTYRDVFSFSILILILILRPAGFFGKFLEEKV